MARLTPVAVTLPCGMRLVHIHDRGASSGIFGVVVGAGSAAEAPSEHGLAHFVEHTIFKGTLRRSSWHIINRMEGIGGELNAYTSKEETVVYTIFPGHNAARAVELIGDLIINSQFPPRELEKERQVVLDEIASYLDNPSEAIYDLFEEKIFAGSPLAHNILGSEESVEGLGTAECRRFLEQHYTRTGTVAFYCGPQCVDTVARLVDRHMATLPAGTARTERPIAPAPAPFDIVMPQPTHQAHVLTGIHTGGMRASERFAVSLLTNMTGGPGMNSLLNVELREKRGLVYTVEASTAFFEGRGYMGVYFGCDVADTARCRRLIDATFARVAGGSATTTRRLEAAKKQYIGQRAVASENRENAIVGAARSLLFFGVLRRHEAIDEAIRSVSAADIAAVAARFAEASTLIISPDGDL